MQTDEPINCASCGYDLRGLPTEVQCPECGSESRRRVQEVTSTTDGKIMQMIDANIVVKDLAPVPDIRVRMKYWMKLGGIFFTILLFLQLLVTFATIPIGLYRLVLFVLSLFWPTVVIGMMPSKVDESMPPMYAMIRKIVPYTQWCWAIGYGLWIILHVPREDFTLGGNLKYFPIILLLHAAAGIGLAGIAFWLHDLALRLDLTTVAKRCNLFAVTTLTWGVLVFVLPWKHFAAANLGEIGFLFYAYILALMVPWLWMVSLFARALFEFSADASWSLRYDDGLEGRQERISKKRKEYEQKRGW